MLGNSNIRRVVNFYTIKFRSVYGFEPKILNWGKTARLLSKLLNFYTEVQLASLVMVHFEWRGADGMDEFVFKKLSNACFPLDWLSQYANSYEAYLRNVIKLEFDNQEKVFDFVEKELSTLTGYNRYV